MIRIAIYAGSLTLILILLIRARNIVCIPLTSKEWFLKPFCKGILLARNKNRVNGSLGFFQGLPFLGREEKNCLRYLSRLSPGKDMRVEAGRVMVRRLGYGLFLLTIGLVLALMLAIYSRQNSFLQEGNTLQRGDYGEGEVERKVIAGAEEYEESFDVVVKERSYSKQEVDDFVSKAELAIDELLTIEDQEPFSIKEDVELPGKIDGMPFSITWESDRYDLIDPYGEVQNEELEKPETATLTADLCYDDSHYYISRTVVVFPREYSDLQRLTRELQKAIEDSQKRTKTEEYLPLPTSVSGKDIEWKEEKQDSSFALLGLFLIACVASVYAGNKDLKKKIVTREKTLLIEYPELVSKLTLYLGSGMSVRNVFRQMGAAYKLRKEKQKESDPLYEEILITCNELSGGVSETDAYEHFGKRCGLRQYIRFSALLNQNRKKGSVDLIRMLKKESGEAFDQRKALARKAGEEAGTKLLLPMIMMLCVVMVIIIIPAYLSFSF